MKEIDEKGERKKKGRTQPSWVKMVDPKGLGAKRREEERWLDRRIKN